MPELPRNRGQIATVPIRGLMPDAWGWKALFIRGVIIRSPFFRRSPDRSWFGKRWQGGWGGGSNHSPYISLLAQPRSSCTALRAFIRGLHDDAQTLVAPRFCEPSELPQRPLYSYPRHLSAFGQLNINRASRIFLLTKSVRRFVLDPPPPPPPFLRKSRGNVWCVHTL